MRQNGRPKITDESERRITASFALPRRVVEYLDRQSFLAGLSRSAWLTRTLTLHASAPLHPNPGDSRAAD